jgi:hypothetical protein
VDPILKIEVEGNLRVDHPDVFTTFFGGIPQLQGMATAVFQNCRLEAATVSRGNQLGRSIALSYPSMDDYVLAQ